MKRDDVSKSYGMSRFYDGVEVRQFDSDQPGVLGGRVGRVPPRVASALEYGYGVGPRGFAALLPGGRDDPHELYTHDQEG